MQEDYRSRLGTSHSPEKKAEVPRSFSSWRRGRAVSYGDCMVIATVEKHVHERIVLVSVWPISEHLTGAEEFHIEVHCRSHIAVSAQHRCTVNDRSPPL